MASLVDFSPLLEATKGSERAAELRAQSFERAASGVARAFDVIGERGRRREKEFNSIFDFDFNKRANDISRAYLVDKYNQIKRDGVKMFMEDKDIFGRGRLSPYKKIELDSNLDSFEKEAQLLDTVNKEIAAAKKLQTEKPYIRLDEGRIKKYLTLLHPAENGKYDTEGMGEFLAETRESPTGQAFTTYADFDPEFHLNQSIPLLKEEVKSDVAIDEESIDKGGKRTTKTYESTKYGTELERRKKYYEMLSNSDSKDWYENQIGEKLSEQERREAIAQYGNRTINPMSAYYAYNKADMITGFEDKRRLKRTDVMPIAEKKDSKAGDGSWTNIRETDIGWDFGTTPIAISKSLGGETYKNAAVVGVERDETDNYTAKLIIPKGKNEYLEVFNKAREEGRDLSNEEVAFIMSETMNPDKYKTIKVPLEDIYDELKTGFKKKKLNLEGYENIVFPEQEQESTAPEEKQQSTFIGVPKGGF